MKHTVSAPYTKVIRRHTATFRRLAHRGVAKAKSDLAKAKSGFTKATSSQELAKHLPKNPNNDLLFEISNQALHVSTDEPVSLLETLKLLVSPGSEKQPRTRALIQLTHRLMPKLTQHYAKRTISRMAKLSPNQPKLIAHGTAHNIFLINIKSKQYALKVNVHSQRIKSDLARRNLYDNIKADASKIHSWFGHIPGLIPKQQVVILNAPPMNRPAVVTIQPYIAGEKTDLFSLNDTKLTELLAQKPYLKAPLLSFATETTHIFKRTHQAPELAGDDNLAFISKPGRKTRLMLLDANYVLTPSRSRAWHRPARSLHYARLTYLKKLTKLLKK